MPRQGWVHRTLLPRLVAACLLTASSICPGQGAQFDGTYYFRVRVGLSHKGLPIDFDVVVACGVKIGGNGSVGYSYDVLGWQPFVYAKRIAGDHAVLVRTTAEASPCGRATSPGGGGRDSEDGAITSDWLPLIVWYNDYRNLSEGLGYATADAYANPNSQLEFHGARVDRATKAEFEAFVRTAPQNLVPNYLAGGISNNLAPHIGFNKPVPTEVVDQPWRAWSEGGVLFCHGVERVKLPEYQRKMIAPFWPASHPHFWSVAPEAQAQLVQDLFPGGTKQNSLFRYPAPAENNRRYDHVSDAEAYGVFPIYSDWSLSRIGKDTDTEHQNLRIEIGDGKAHKGMVSCQSLANRGVLAAVTKKPASSINPFVKPTCYYDGLLVRSTPQSFCGNQENDWITFEDDDYAVLNLELQAIFL